MIDIEFRYFFHFFVAERERPYTIYKKIYSDL
jgi:hypothetical protein